MTPRLAICCGEPAGIGIDLLLKVSYQQFDAHCIIIADASVIQERAKALGVDVELIPYLKGMVPAPAGKLATLDIKCQEAVNPGVLNKANASYVLKTLVRATAGCQSGEFDAMVTLPLHKGVINDAGIPFSGHTEYLAELTHAKMPQHTYH